MNEEDLFDMSDEELEAAVKEAKISAESPEIDEEFEETFSEDTTDDVDSEEEIVVDDDDSEDEESEITSEEEEDGPEQSEDDENLEDSDHDASEDSDEKDAEEEDTPETDEETTDEDSEAEDEESSDEAEKSEEAEQPAQMYKFKANGKDYEFSSTEIVDQFPRIFGQAMDYTKKMQAIKPWRKTIDAIEGAELKHDDVNLMIDVLKGDKDAITEVLKRTGTDTLELDTESATDYVAKDYGRDDGALAIKDVIDVISQDQEYATTHSIISKEWDEKSWNVMSENPQMIKLLHSDVKSGMFDELQPVAEKLKVFDGAAKSDLDYYKEAAQQHYDEIAKQEAFEKREAERTSAKQAAEAEKAKVAKVKADSKKRNETKKASVKRKAAAPSKSAAAGREVINYLEDSDESFDEWYKNLQDSM